MKDIYGRFEKFEPMISNWLIDVLDKLHSPILDFENETSTLSKSISVQKSNKNHRKTYYNVNKWTSDHLNVQYLLIGKTLWKRG